MADVTRRFIEVPSGYRCREAALFVEQLDDQTRRLREDLQGIEPAELEWQPALGMNTIGMLLAHNAIVEVFWTQIGIRGDQACDTRPQLGIGMDDDGMPLPAGKAAPANLAGHPLAFYLDLLDRARAYLKQAAAGLTDADLETVHSRTRRNGEYEEFSVRWVLYHQLEHFASHYGQILLQRHHYGAFRERAAATASSQ